jgi:hypothetical protein
MWLVGVWSRVRRRFQMLAGGWDEHKTGRRSWEDRVSYMYRTRCSGKVDSRLYAVEQPCRDERSTGIQHKLRCAVSNSTCMMHLNLELQSALSVGSNITYSRIIICMSAFRVRTHVKDRSQCRLCQATNTSLAIAVLRAQHLIVHGYKTLLYV